jgi:hypothetical protein
MQVVTRGCLFLMLLCASAALADIQAGNWEFTVDVGIEGAGSSSGPVVKTRCITEEEARDPSKVLADTGSSQCRFSNVRDTGSTYTFDVDCPSAQVPLRGSGNVRYAPQSLEGEIALIVEQQNLRIQTRSTISARRLGPCNL